ncbi:MAG: DNA repair exonuclease [Burkholderiales bacterium]|nr:DNA repair exonuclease [Burkholderiales bacterium]
MTRILHTADWQIGKRFGMFDPDDGALLAEARFDAVDRLARLATEHRVDLVLVAGDVFDAQGVADKTILRLFNAMAAFAGPWVLIPGNHDAALAESVWTRAERLGAIPTNVCVCVDPTPVIFDALRIAVLPAPLNQRHTHADLTEGFAAIDTAPSLLRIGLAHGSVQGILADDIDSPNPIAVDRATRARLDYLALGDWHGTKSVDPRTWYAGTPEADRFRANDSGYALQVELSDPGILPVVTRIATGRYRWQSVEAAVQIASDIERIAQMLDTFGPDDVVQLTLSGQIDLAGHRRLQEAITQAQARARSVRADLSALRLEPTSDDIEALQADGYLGDVVADLRAGQDGPDAETCRDALALLAGLLDERRARHGTRGSR